MHKYEILVIDDKSDNLKLLHQLLSNNGYKVRAVASGETALTVVENWLPDLILLDIMMPGLDGFETCQRLKQSSRTADIPIIFLTAKISPNDVIHGFELGAVDYVTKPFIQGELLSRIRTQLELKQSKENLKEKNGQLKELVHVLCHDLANPFNSVKAALNMIEEDVITFEEISTLLNLSVDKGLETIGLIREMSKLDHRVQKLKLESIQLTNAISDSIAILNPILTGKQIAIDNQVSDGLFVVVEKSSFISSVLNNILTNAIKFSHPGSSIVLNAEKQDDLVRFSIRDYGIGMTQKMIHELFDVSKTTSRIGTNGEQGTGFGMPLLKKFVEAYGGQLNICSNETQDDNIPSGTEVTLLLSSG